ncbi:MAG: nucleotidyl transferase AbiEii/AbiGii toxin family protein [Phascolarctobacterium sp.]|nr:nucleotidyl transferase AbiEii/AbiGii toxin family protein [Phascolarctobacterium sp.]
MLDREELKKIFSTVSTAIGKDAVFIEKDYYQTLMLQEIAKISDKLVFKGGTSLSKCYGLINRFSEDIDISATCKLTEGERRNIYHGIINAAVTIGLSFPDDSKTKSKRLYNKFVFEYDSVITETKLSLIIETNYNVPVYPVAMTEIPNFVSLFFINKSVDLPADLELHPLVMNVQQPIRTLIDKLFALCDYYMKGEQAGHSRHLYDVHCLYRNIRINQEFIDLFKKVREERASSKMNPSANADVDFKSVFKKVINDDIYRKDYESITKILLYEKCEYEDVQESLINILHNLKID